MNLKELIFALLFSPIMGLIQKDFEKHFVINHKDTNFKEISVVDFTELVSIPGLNRIYCSYYCLKDEAGCQAFYIHNETSCRKINMIPNQCYEKGESGKANSVAIYSAKKINIVGKFLTTST